MQAHILILDDDPDDMDLLQQCFSIENFKNVIFFTRASAALAYLLSSTDLPSLIVTDCHMPENSGVEFVSAIRARDKLS